MMRKFKLRRATGSAVGRRQHVRLPGSRTRTAVAAVVAVGAGLVVAGLALAGAVSTTDNPGFIGPDTYTNQAAENGHGVNGNIYLDKRDVWLSGLPNGAIPPDGSYFFAVLSPGGQPAPNDGGTNKANGALANLSDDKDAYTNRTFTISGGAITAYGGTHQTDTNADSSLKIQLFDYADTPNQGGVYILAVCSLANGYPVVPKDCKYDAFKVKAGTPPPPPCTENCGPGAATDLGISKTVTPTFNRAYDWSVTKQVTSSNPFDTSASTAKVGYQVTATWSGPTDSGWDVQGTITVSNSNTTAFTGVSVGDQIVYGASDTPDANANCVISNGTADGKTYDVDPGQATIPATGSVDFPYDCNFKNGAPADTGAETNVATATWDGSVNNTPNCSNPVANTTDCSASFAAAFAWGIDPDDGNPTVTDDTTTITDTFNGGTADKLGTADVSGTFSKDGTNGLADWSYGGYDPTSQTYTFSYSRTVAVTAGTCTTYNNTAAVTDADDSAADTDHDTADAAVQVCGGANLTADKSANGNFTRTYKWKISKAADATKKTALFGQVKFTYTVTVTSDSPAYVDSAWTVTGSITAYNPNDWEDVTANFADSIGLGWSCVVTNGTSVTVPRATVALGGTVVPGSASRNYTCTWSGTGAPSGGTNTATVTWTGAFTPGSSTTGTANFAFTTPTTEVNKTITVTDPAYDGVSPPGTPGTLGSVTYGQDTLPKKFVYDRYVAVPSTGCTTYPNTATITQTGQSAGASVQACRVPPATGALTMGFWQNKNGQAIITGGSATSGVCNLATYLWQFAPFQDMKHTTTQPYQPTSSCNDVASYVTNIIKAANASGAAMNAMLKAQMLATALDVYFSDSSLGGNKIGAPAAIGGIKIDLTTICKMSDSSSGGTCSNAYSNASAAFGGASSLTVSQILAYAASQSNVGGLTWYGQSKTTQELAKNTFDAINNQVAFQAGP